MTEATKQAQTPRLLTTDELAEIVKIYREHRKWSQEQLAEISGLNTRTIQRIEGADASSLDSRRALARAFELEDIDAFNKPYDIPTNEELEKLKKDFEEQYVTSDVHPLNKGKKLAGLAEESSMDLFHQSFELSREAESDWARLVDYTREFRDCADMYNETDRLPVYDELQDRISSLRDQGVSLVYATRQMTVRSDGGKSTESFPVTVLFVTAFPVGEEPKQILTPKSMPFKF